MRFVKLVYGILPLSLIASLGFAANVDVVVSGTTQDVQGCCDKGFVRTRGTLSASANLYQSDDRSPTIRSQAWLWSFPEDFDPTRELTVLREGNAPEMWVYTWNSEEQHEQLAEKRGDLRREFQRLASAPGVLSRWVSTSDEEWRLAVEPLLQQNALTIRPRLERIRRWKDTVTTTSVRLPPLFIPAGESRIVPVVFAEPEAAPASPLYLELRPSYGWEGNPPRIRRREYTNSWTDRVDVGGQLRVEGVYTKDVVPR